MQELEIEYTQGIALLRFARPDSLNAMTPDMEGSLRDAIEAAADDPDVRVIVLTGKGRAFCAGADLKEVKAGDYYQKQGKVLQRAADSPAPYQGRFSYMALCPKPIVAGINGAAVGVGMTIALHCDIRVASDNARLSLAFARLGLAAEEGVAYLLQALVGGSQAMELLLTGRTLSAAEARSAGLVCDVLAADGFQDALLERFRGMAIGCSPEAMRRIKTQVWESRLQDYGRSVASAREHIAQTRIGPDFCEAVASFAEKRAPRFQGLGAALEE